MIRQGTIVWVDTLTNIARQQDEESRAKEAKIKAEELVDRVFYIRNLQAMELQTALRQYLSPRGVMNVSQGSNALIVRDTESKLAVMKQLVDGLDLQVPQVQIEARIVQADTVYARGIVVEKGGVFTGDLNIGQDEWDVADDPVDPDRNIARFDDDAAAGDQLLDLRGRARGIDRDRGGVVLAEPAGENGEVPHPALRGHVSVAPR